MAVAAAVLTTAQEAVLAEVELPDLGRYHRIALDTETTGLTVNDRAVGLSYKLPDGKHGYLAWGHEGGNNCTIEEVRAWARQLERTDLLKVFFNAYFDLRMLAYDTPGEKGVPGPGIKIAGPIEDGIVITAILNEIEEKFSLDALCKKYCDGMEKKDDYLNEWCAAQFGGKPDRGQAKNYWRTPWGVMDEYATWDSDMADALYLQRRPQIDVEQLREIYDVETALIPLLLQMHLTGVRVDVDGAERAKLEFARRKDEAQLVWDRIAPGVNPLSTDQLVPVFDKYGLPYGKTKAGNPSIDKAVLDALPDDNEVAVTLKTLKEVSKMSGTFVENYILACAIDGIVHGQFHQLPNDDYGAVSGRFSSSEPCLQNLPGDKHPELMRIIRGLFIPYLPEQSWYKWDYSQIEYRFLAHYAGGKLRRQYNETPDIDFHQMLADMINMPDVCNRRRTKNVNFAIVYGASTRRAAQTAGITEALMRQVEGVYHDATDHQIKRLSQKAVQAAKNRGYIITWGRRKRRFMDAARARAKGWKVYGGERYVKTHAALNALLQGSAADLMKRAMVAVARSGVIDWTNTFLHLTVHDELGASGPDRRSAAGIKFAGEVKELMQNFELSVPIIADCKAGPNWGDVEKI